jgi:hypothetical protein
MDCTAFVTCLAIVVDYSSSNDYDGSYNFSERPPLAIVIRIARFWSFRNVKNHRFEPGFFYSRAAISNLNCINAIIGQGPKTASPLLRV